MGKSMDIAALWGTTVGYSEINDTVVIETNEGRVAVIRRETFDYLYFRLDKFTAALKEDCIRYFIYQPYEPLFNYPEWVIQAIKDNWIVKDDYSFVFIGDVEIVNLDQTSVILKNFKGELKHMELDQFHKYYDILGG